MPKGSNKNKGAKVYNRLLKEFTKVNNLLPENRKLSLKVRRKIVSDSLYPAFKESAPSRLRVKDIQRRIYGIIDMIPPNTECNPLTIRDSDLAEGIEWYDLEEFIEKVLPNCIFVRVFAYDLGDTGIFNTRDFQFHKGKLHNIVENCRALTTNNSGKILFYGEKSLIDGRPDDGFGENYYILLRPDLGGIGVEMPDIDVDIIVPRANAVDNLDAKEQVRKRLNKLNKEKASRKRLYKKIGTKITAATKLKSKFKKSTNKKKKEQLQFTAFKEIQSARRSLYNAYKKGLITEETYIKKLNKLTASEFKRGGKL